ncbi:LLM class flavin-dependent oxidoreductase, partial [Aldersonia kunmingensis]|uniref:LLM class flavin-dependent oxidoreductase n=1 Tax=Aldersonia kunmingensis TaxID=408066 RepID=UPI00082E8028
IANPVVRGPMPLAKSLSAIDVLSSGRLVAALGPGSSANDYNSVGLPFEQRWPRFDEAVAATRAILRGNTFSGRFYDVGDERAAPVHGDGPPLWIGSWGSAVGLRRVARLGDGWLASAYHMSAESIGDGRRRLSELLTRDGRNPEAFPIGVATMWFHLDEAERADRVLQERVAPATNRPAEMLAPRLAFGPPEAVAEKLAALHAAGAARVFLWPVADEFDQLRRFAADVMPLLT